MPRSGMSVALAALCTLSACSFQASCGDGGNLNSTKLEKSIAKYVEGEMGQAPDKVVCPKKVKLEEGGELDCQVTLGSESGTVHVVQTDAEGSVNYGFADSVISFSKLEALMAQRLKDGQGVDATVECGDKIRDSKTGDEFACIATDGAGAKVSIAVSVTDDAGNVKFGAITPVPSQ